MSTSALIRPHLYARFASAAERGAWSIDRDIAWHAVDRDRALSQPNILASLRGAALIESFHPVNLARFLRVLWDDVDGCAAVGLEMYEGFKHFHALRMYLDIVGFEPVITDEEIVELRRAGVNRDFPASEVIEHLVEFMLSEHLAAYFFRRLAERAEEPVLIELLRYIAADEVRHAQSASDLIAKRLARDPALTDRVLAAAVTFHHYGEEAVGEVPVALPGDAVAIRTFADRIERLCGRRLVDHLKSTL
ncbi:MAG TPA: ferritin-like domain-containing protein [Gemmatimonadaceae bacterium]|nr:ferritin-like domain-containing protein [Gemmatimonadaceae bacterium]